MAIALIIEAKNGISSLQLSRNIDVTYKTAWFLSHKIRKALEDAHNSIMTLRNNDDTSYTARKHADKITKISTLNIKSVTTDQISNMVDNQIHALTANQIKVFNSNQLQSLDGSKLNDNQIKNIFYNYYDDIISDVLKEYGCYTITNAIDTSGRFDNNLIGRYAN